MFVAGREDRVAEQPANGRTQRSRTSHRCFRVYDGARSPSRVNQLPGGYLRQNASTLENQENESERGMRRRLTVRAAIGLLKPRRKAWRGQERAESEDSRSGVKYSTVRTM